MANYRRGHQANQGGLRMIVLIAVFMVVLAGILLITNRSAWDPFFSSQVRYSGPEVISEYLPVSDRGQTVHHRHFSLSYVEDYEQAQWVAYELTVEELNARRVPRHDWFNADYSVRTRSAFYRDYSNSGYSRGHLAPAADMAFDTLAMRESFYMSNISPQVRAFNGGIWRELEEQTRDWARENGRLLIVTGPVLSETLPKRIGRNRVAVPELFYKVLLDPDEPVVKSIAFLIPNALSDEPLMRFAVSIDSVESVTQLDFFPQLQNIVNEEQFDADLWPVDMHRFQRRITEWNKQ